MRHNLDLQLNDLQLTILVFAIKAKITENVVDNNMKLILNNKL